MTRLLVSESQYHILSFLKGKDAIVPLAHWHTNTIASLIRRGFIRIRGKRLQITALGSQVHDHAVKVKYSEWLKDLHITAVWRA